MNDVFAPSGCINWVQVIYRLGFQNVAVDHTNGESALTGCSYKKAYGHFPGTKLIGSTKVTVLIR